MKKLMHVQEILVVCWLQTRLLVTETEQHVNILHHYFYEEPQDTILLLPPMCLHESLKLWHCPSLPTMNGNTSRQRHIFIQLSNTPTKKFTGKDRMTFT